MSSLSFSQFLAQRKRRQDQSHTHTWFASGPEGNRTSTLHIDDEDVPTLRKALVSEASRRRASTDSSKGPASLSEKLTKDRPFRLAADLDFKVEDIRTWGRDKGYNDGDTLKENLIDKMREVALLFRSTVSQCTEKDEAELEMVIATRLPYKIHLYFPDIIVDSKGAKGIATTFDKNLQETHSDIYSGNVVDTSVYNTGLRLLYCHKGSMTAETKRQEELEAHENMFGPGSYRDAYFVTDIGTWKQKLTPSVRDLEKTSVQILGDEEATLTPLKVAKEKITPKGKEKGKGKASTTQKGKGKRGAQSDSGDALSAFLSETFDIPVEDIRLSDKTERGEKVIIPTRSRDCPFAEREHNSNQLYIVLTRDEAELRCHDEECTETRKVSFGGILSNEAEADLLQLLGLEVSSEEQRLEAVSASLKKVKKLHPKMNCNISPDAVSPSTLGGNGYVVALRENRWCPLCCREHDSAENCILTLQREQLILCNRNIGNPISIPLSPEHMKLIFNVQNLHINVNTGGGSEVGEVRDFGDLDEFPDILPSADLNRLCHASLTSRTYDVAEFLAQLMKGQYLYQGKTWYCFTGQIWKQCPGPDELMTRQVTQIYKSLQQTYREEKQVKWLNGLIEDLGNMSRRKPYIEDLERYLEMHSDPMPLDGDPYLIGFANGVFDARDASFREHRAEDWLTTLLPYAVPETPDPEIKKCIDKFMSDIMPAEDMREFLWQMLALHLAGENAESVAMVWTGTGGNGKGILKRLMRFTFCDLHSEPPATFLTSESPSPDRPAPHLVKLRHARSVFASEPESNKKINSAFVKFITGDDLLEVRACHSNDIVAFYPRFVVTMLCNAIPLFQGAQDEVRGLWRRLRILTFGQEFVDNPTLPHHKKKDANLKIQLLDWPPHFMRMLMDRYAGYLASNREIPVPVAVRENLEEQKQENSPFDQWIRNNLVQSNGGRTHVHRLPVAFRKYMRVVDPSVPIPSDAKTKQKLIQMGYRVQTDASQRQRDTGCFCKSGSIYIQDVTLVAEE